MIGASAKVVVTLLCLTFLAVITAPSVNAYYGYPAPRHSDVVTHEATSLIAALDALKTWLRGLGEPVTRLSGNPNLTEWGNAMLENVTSPSEYALLVGGVQLKALKVLAGLNPAIKAQDIVRVLNASINYVVMQGVVNSTRVMWRALTDRASCRVALNYVALSIARSPKGNSSIALRALSAIAAFQESIATRRYGDARMIMRGIAENASLVVAAYMACQLPPQSVNGVAQPPSVGEGRGSSNGNVVISAEDMLKAVAVLERLGPKAIEILSKVPMAAVVNAVSKVPLNVLRNMSVDEIVREIEIAAASSNAALNAGTPATSPSASRITPSMASTGRSTGNASPSITVGERPPIPRHWIKPQLSSPSQALRGSGGPAAINGGVLMNYATVPAIGTLVEVVKSVSLPTPSMASASMRWWSLTLTEAGNIKTVAGVREGTGATEALPAPLLTLLLGFAVFAALTLTLRTKRETDSARPLPKAVVSKLPAVVREFWEAVAVASKVSGVELRADLTHREIVGELARKLGAEAGRALLKLSVLYEGVRYAGVKVTRELSLTAQGLLREVRALIEAK